jgi:ATP-binding cassette, subfamily B, bacterial
MLKLNPIVYLALTGWEHAGRYRPAIVAYCVLFLFANAINLAEPYVIGLLLNAVQENATQHANLQRLLHDVYFYLALFFAIQFFWWAFNGPGRMIQSAVQYHTKANYTSHLFHLVTDMPLQWHREHHSGDSIDKINRACNSLAQFHEQTFLVLEMLLRFFGAQVILFWFMPAAGWAAMATTVIVLTVMFCLDKILHRNYMILNKFDNRVASAIHDYTTNIISVKTLRLEQSVLKEVAIRFGAA